MTPSWNAVRPRSARSWEIDQAAAWRHGSGGHFFLLVLSQGAGPSETQPRAMAAVRTASGSAPRLHLAAVGAFNPSLKKGTLRYPPAGVTTRRAPATGDASRLLMGSAERWRSRRCQTSDKAATRFWISAASWNGLGVMRRRSS